MFMNSLLSFEDFAAAFSLDYECVFFVDVATGNYSMYAFRGGHKNLELTETSDFWADTKVNLEAFVFKEDKKGFAEVVNKDFLLKAVQHDSVFKFKYRLQMGEEVVWFQMKVILGHSQCRDYLVIGVNNIDQQERERLDLEHRASKSRIYGQIVMALAERYDALYMVNVETGHFAQYKSERAFNELSVARNGEDFFNQLRIDAESVVYKEDRPLICSALTQETLLKELDDNGVFTLTYRINSLKGPLYMNLVAVYSDKSHIVISVTNVDAQVRREQKIKEEASAAYAKSLRDDLTGIKNKKAYCEFENRLNLQIQSGESVRFAIAICDVNGLKMVNDTYGHIAGDEYIRSASKHVCETFKHSPVFRVGGDEFVVILLGSDFENREKLEQDFVKKVNDSTGKNKVSLACGISVFDPAHDKNVSVVFERADALMYKNKVSMKGGRDEIIDAVV